MGERASIKLAQLLEWRRKTCGFSRAEVMKRRLQVQTFSGLFSPPDGPIIGPPMMQASFQAFEAAGSRTGSSAHWGCSIRRLAHVVPSTNSWIYRTYVSHSIQERHDATTQSSETQGVGSEESANQGSSSDERATPSWCSPETDDNESDMSSSFSESDSESEKAKLFSPSVLMGENVEALEGTLKELEMTSDAEDLRIGGVCLRLAQLCDSLNEEPAKVCSYGQRALQILGSPDVSSETAMCCHVIGSAYHKMDEQEKAIEHLERSAMVIEKLGPSKEREVGALKYAVHFLLGQIKMSLGRHDEALLNFQQGVAINEKILEPGNPDLAMSYQLAAEAFMEAGDPDEALVLCQKALPIYTNYYGLGSSQVTTLRRIMSVVYNHLEEYEKVLSEHKIIRPILQSMGKSNDVATLDLASGDALISLERYEEAIEKLKVIVNETGESSYVSRHALVQIARVYSIVEEHKDAAKYCKRAWNALKSQGSLEDGASLVELSAVYRKLNELDQSMDVLRKALSVLEQNPEQKEAIAEAEGQMGLLHLLMRKPLQGLPCLEKAAAKLEGIYGQGSEELLAVYNHIAIANLEIGKLDDALAKFEAARKIAVEIHGPDDPDTIAIYKNLVNTYSAVGRFEQAIKCQKHIVNSMKKTEELSDDASEEAEKTLNELVEKRQLSRKNATKQESD